MVRTQALKSALHVNPVSHVSHVSHAPMGKPASPVKVVAANAAIAGPAVSAAMRLSKARLATQPLRVQARALPTVAQRRQQ